MRNYELILHDLLHGRSNREDQKQLMHWVKKRPKRLDKIRSALWVLIVLENSGPFAKKIPYSSSLGKKVKHIEKLVLFFNKMSERYPSRHWLGMYRRYCSQSYE